MEKKSEKVDKAATYGIGLKLLQKMGYQEGQGIGKDENKGIIKPLEGTVRPKSLGLGFSDEVLPIRKDKGKHFKLKASDSESEDSDDISDSYEKQQIDLYKKGYKNAKKNQKESGRYFDFLNEDNISSSKNLKQSLYKDETIESYSAISNFPIIDRRGPKEKFLSSGSEINSSQYLLPIPPAKEERFAELTSNIQYLVYMAEKDIRETTEMLNSLKKTCLQIKKENEVLSNQSAAYQSVLEKHQKMFELLSHAKSLLKSTWSSSLASSLTRTMVEIQRLLEVEQDQTFKNLLNDALFSLFIPYFKRQFALWHVNNSPTWFNDDGVAFFLVLEKIGYHLKGRNNFKNPSKSLLDVLLSTLWLPRVRSYVNHPDWSMADPFALTEMLNIWWPVVPLSLQKQIMNELILPKLISFVDQYDRSNSYSSLRSVYMPFSTLIHPEAKKDVMNHVCIKLQTTFSQWHPSDPSAFDVISPWNELMDPSTFDSFLSKTILPKLVTVLRHEFSIDPKNQNLEPLEWIFQWADLIPLSRFVSLLENEFFPKWMSVLYLWLTSTPNYDQVAHWFLGWKSVFPDEINSHPAVQMNFRRGLDIVNGILDNPSLSLDAFLLKKFNK